MANALLLFQAREDLRFEFPTTSMGVAAAQSYPAIFHTEDIAPGISFPSGGFEHVTVDLSPLGVDDSWAVFVTFVSNDPGFDNCVIGQPHWNAGVGDMHIFKFGAPFVTSTTIKLRCLAVKVL